MTSLGFFTGCLADSFAVLQVFSLRGNTAGGEGGAVSSSGNSSIVLLGGDVTVNVADHGGGVALSEQSSMLGVSVDFLNNSATGAILGSLRG